MAWICPHCRQSMTPSTHTCGQQQAVASANRSMPFRTRPRPLSDFNGTTKTLISHNPRGIYPGYVRRYDAAMQNWGNDIGSRASTSEWMAFRNKYTVADLSLLGNQDHLDTISEIWKEIVEFRPYDTPVRGMTDLETPNHRSSLTNPGFAAFSARGYAYRCDARQPASVLKLGFKPLYNINPPDSVQGTIMHHCTTGSNGVPQSAGFWIGNRDIVNQTSICVARTLRGCGKFPTPSATGEHYFYVMRLPANKRGFDTEKRQIQTGGRWLPGEKAFPLLTPSEIIAWTKVNKLGSDNGSDAFETFSYVIIEPRWNFTAHADADDKSYLQSELIKLTGWRTRCTITVTKAEDFVAGQ